MQGAGPGRVQQGLVEAVACPGHGHVGAIKVGDLKSRVLDAVGLGIAPGALDQAGVALHPDDRTRAPRQGQGKVAQTTEKIQHPFLRPGIEQIHRPPHHEAVQFQIDLGEVGGLEMDLDPEVRQAVMEIDRLARQGADGLEAALLEIDPHLVRGREGLQTRQVRCGGGREHPKYQDAGPLALGDLDLRHLLADAQAVHQFGQGLNPLTHIRVQHLATTQVGEKTRAPLAKAHQGFALLGHIAHPHPRLAAIAPMPRRQGWQPALRRDPADAAQHIRQDLLLHGDLGLRSLMLQAATAADAKMGAAGCHALGRGLQHFHHPTLVEMALQPGVAEADPLPRQSAIDKDGLALDPGQPPALVGQGLDHHLDGFRRQGFAFRFRQGRSKSLSRAYPPAPGARGRRRSMIKRRRARGTAAMNRIAGGPQPSFR